MNKSLINIFAQSFYRQVPFLSNKNQGAELLGHTVDKNLALKRTVRYLSKVVKFYHFAFYTPTDKI